MKTIENVTIYKCDFCQKELKRKHAMASHENLCNQNPKNSKQCHFCQHLEETEIEVYIDSRHYNDDGVMTKVKSFKCNKLDKLMYPYSIEKRDLPNKYPDTFEDQEPMPNKCESFEEVNYF